MVISLIMQLELSSLRKKCLGCLRGFVRVSESNVDPSAGIRITRTLNPGSLCHSEFHFLVQGFLKPCSTFQALMHAVFLAQCLRGLQLTDYRFTDWDFRFRARYGVVASSVPKWVLSLYTYICSMQGFPYYITSIAWGSSPP